GSDLVLGELPHRLAEELVLLGQPVDIVGRVDHGATSWSARESRGQESRISPGSGVVQDTRDPGRRLSAGPTTLGIPDTAVDSLGARVTTTNRPKLSVIGTGYLGATHAVCMTDLGYDVVGVDVEPDKIARLQAGEVPFFEPGLTELLRKNLETG